MKMHLVYFLSIPAINQKRVLFPIKLPNNNFYHFEHFINKNQIGIPK